MKNIIFNNLLSPNLIENFQISFKISALIGIIPSLFFPHLSEWVMLNIDYVGFALGAIALDHILGTYVHLKIDKDWNWQKNISGFGVKLSMVVAFAFLMEGLAHIAVDGDLIYTYIKMAGRFLVIIYPSLSAMKNIKIITKGAFPPDIIIGKLERFNESMNFNEFKNKDEETNKQEEI